MNGKKILIAALSSTLLVGAAATATLAATGDNHGKMGHHGKMHQGRQGWHRMGPPPEVIFIRMVKEFDTNGDFKVSKEEFTTGIDKIYDQIDANHDGQVTPAELKTYRQDKMKAWRDAHKNDTAQNDQNGDQNGKPGDGDQARPEHGRHGGHGPRGSWMREARMMEVMMFARVDTDGSGQISKAEAEAFANKIFDRMDRNHDGVISIDDMPDRPFP
ncbi:calcium-binding protein [Rhizobium sp. BK376]|uniref:EF-hand domain-containing protein n=1 Tax=Rhizobium sp. BK376 TaxID=2512149 RepID=UPI0010526E6B|nr:calcium-binding protein [Rhizobium sp. BK376]TCR90905.1 EF hand domain-containing protein [Rhizobium sp. BK376]